eukprot:GILK01006832.1.p1 GENE.GILK01006832.1~~GILK01006832.1.p1  ORF type:complete len:1102 (-),score=139.57 GILK01006832.1:209-3514(-)
MHRLALLLFSLCALCPALVSATWQVVIVISPGTNFASGFNNETLTGVIQVQDDNPGSLSYITSNAVLTEASIASWSSSGYNQVLVFGGGMTTVIVAAAPNYPSMRFSIIDDCSTPPLPSNMQCAVFRDHHASYVVGHLAGMLTVNKTLGIVAGFPTSAVKRLFNGFARGVKNSCPDCVVLGQYLPSFQLSTEGTAVATYFYNEHIDVVYTIAQSPARSYLAARNVMAVGASTNTLPSVVKMTGKAAYMLMSDALSGGTSHLGSIWYFDFSNGGLNVTCGTVACPLITASLWTTAYSLESQLADAVISAGVDDVTGDVTLVPVSTADNAWVSITPIGLTPKAVSSHSIVSMPSMDGETRLVLFGGLSDVGPVNALWSFYPGSKLWRAHTSVNLVDPSDVWPVARSEHSAVKLGDLLLVVFGGRQSDLTRLDDVWVFSSECGAPIITTEHWYKLTTTGTKPDARSTHSAVPLADNSSMLVFGGRAAFSLQNDLWKIDIDTSNLAGGTHTWTQIIPISTTLPAARMSHAAFFDGVKMYVFGGRGDNSISLTDLWVFDTGALTWTQLASAPYNRDSMVSAYMPLNTSMVMVAVGGQDSNLVAYNNSFYYNSATNIWKDQPSISSPLSRSSSAGGAVDQTLLMFGGKNGSIHLNDLNVYNFVQVKVCLTVNCNGHGTCEGSTGTAVCTCDAGYSGSLCDSCDTVNGFELQAVGTCAKRPEWLPSASVQYVFTAISAIGIVCTIPLMVFIQIYKQRKHPVILSSSAPFMHLICFGVVFGFATAIVLMQRPLTVSLCRSTSWLISISFITVFGPFFAKSYRIMKLFNNRKLKRLRVTNWDLMKVVGLIFAIEMAIQIARISVADDSVSAVAHPQSFTSVLVCSQSAAANTVEIIGYVYKGGLLAWGVYLAYHTRNATAEFNESKLIAVCIYNVAICCAAFIPVIFIVGNNPDASYPIIATAINLALYATTIVMFAPKVMMIYGKIATVTPMGTNNTNTNGNTYGNTYPLSGTAHHTSWDRPSTPRAASVETIISYMHNLSISDIQQLEQSLAYIKEFKMAQIQPNDLNSPQTGGGETELLISPSASGPSDSAMMTADAGAPPFLPADQ